MASPSKDFNHTLWDLSLSGWASKSDQGSKMMETNLPLWNRGHQLLSSGRLHISSGCSCDTAGLPWIYPHPLSPSALGEWDMHLKVSSNQWAMKPRQQAYIYEHRGNPWMWLHWQWLQTHLPAGRVNGFSLRTKGQWDSAVKDLDVALSLLPCPQSPPSWAYPGMVCWPWTDFRKEISILLLDSLVWSCLPPWHLWALLLLPKSLEGFKSGFLFSWSCNASEAECDGEREDRRGNGLRDGERGVGIPKALWVLAFAPVPLALFICFVLFLGTHQQSIWVWWKQKVRPQAVAFGQPLFRLNSPCIHLPLNFNY